MVPHPQMGLIRLALALILSLAAPTVALAQEPSQATAPAVSPVEEERLLSLFANDARVQTGLDPVGQLYRGEPVDVTALAASFTDPLDRRRLAHARAMLAALAQIDRAQLSPERQISYDVFAFDKREAITWHQPDVRELDAARPFNHFGGLHVELPALMAAGGAVPYETTADYVQNLAVLRAIPAVLDNAVVRFRQGLLQNRTEPRLTIEIMLVQLDATLALADADSPFLSPVREFPDTISQADQNNLTFDYVAAVQTEVLPAYQRLRAFLANEYLPLARTSVGLSAQPGGNRLYRLLVQHHTTLPLDPAAIHQTGISEVARIQREMDAVRKQLGDRGTLPAFFEKIRTDPRFHPRSPEELADGFQQTARKVDALAAQYFARQPKTPLLIEPYPEYRGKFEAGGSYNQGSADGRRPGIFYFNTYDLPSRFTSGIATLYLHEGAPGHHFQVSLAQEDESLPDFQRFGGNNAYVEGWALYAETLGFAMGLYQDPLQHWGTLDDEMLRAMRLVVDTGLHTKGWSRDRAITYMLSNSGMGRSDAEAEVDRYIANPGQALSYKIGAMTIQRLRREAEAALGSRFDIRAFHDQVLGSGALPLPVLEAKLRRWIGDQR